MASRIIGDKIKAPRDPSLVEPIQLTIKLKANAQKVVRFIPSGKTKMQAYCQITNLGGQLDQADHEQDEKKTDALMQRIDELNIL